MTEVVSVPLWHLVVFILASVSLGVLLSLVSIALSRRQVKPRVTGTALEQRRRASGSGQETMIPDGPDKETLFPQHKLPLSAENQDRLNRYVSSGRTFTLDEAAALLDAPVRLVRLFLDRGLLKAVPVGDKGEICITAVSIHDYLIRQVTEQVEENPVVASGDETVAGKVEGAAEEASVSPRARYHYFVEGKDEPLYTLRSALEAIGFPLDARSYHDWSGLPAKARAKIRRVPEEGSEK